ncbi:MAG TPA: mechanosensitive ion channel family protein [Pelobium sp.]|nr:mechanosensitive ion channel family protein [Pelobium sp.]
MDFTFLNQVVLGNTVKSYLLFFGILLLGLILKKLISKYLGKLLFIFFQKLSKEIKVDTFLGLLLKPIEFLIVIIILYIATNQLTYPLDVVVFKRATGKESYTIRLIEVIDKLFLLFVILSSFRIVLRLVDFVSHVFAYRASLTESKTDDQLVPFMRELSKILIIIIGVFVVLGAVFNMNIAAIVAGLGIGGIAIALAAQDTLQNLLGSFTIFADKPFVVGDLVHVAGYDAVVEKVGFRSTVVRTLDKTLVIIPNKQMIDSPLENLTLRNLRRVKFNLGVLYGTKPETIKKICVEIKNYIDERNETNMDTNVNFDTFGESALNIQVLYYIEIVDYTIYLNIKEEINFAVMDIVLKNGADFAFPSRTIYHDFGDKALSISNRTEN